MRTINYVVERGLLLCLFLCFAMCITAKKREVFTVIKGDPLVFLQEKKTATFEIDYSQMLVTDGKDHDNDMNFRSWMIAQDEDDEEWLQDWEKKDSAECHKSFREHFNKEVKKGIQLTKLGKDYKVILRFTMIDFGIVKGGKKVLSVLLGGARGLMSPATASGELEVRDLNTDEVLTVIAFNDLVGEERYTQISRLKGIFENIGEELYDYLKEYKKQNK